MLLRFIPLLILLINFCFAQNAKVVTIFPFHFASTDLSEKAALEELNGFFYDLFAGQLASTDYFEVVDRQNMEALLGEVALQQSGLTEQVIQLGKVKGAELAIFGTVTNVANQTFLTMKIIDISTTVIIKAIKQKGSLKKPDELALEAGYTFMQGLSRSLQQRYGIAMLVPGDASKEGLKHFLKARDLIQQAVIAGEGGDEKKQKKFRAEGEKFLEKAYQSEDLRPVIDHYRETVLSYLD